MPEPTYKPVHDEQTLAKLLEAAYVLQEHNREMQRLESRLAQKRDQIETGTAYPPRSAPSQGESTKPSTATANTSTLGKIVETQRQIQVHRLEFESALNLVTERVREAAQARGVAIGMVEGKTVRYRAVVGDRTPALRSSVPLDKSLFAPCLKTGQVFRYPDPNAEFAAAAAECRRRGIQSLIAVPVFHDGGIVGGLELYHDSPDAFTEQDVHTCQLMAGLVAEALVREEEVSWKKSLASQRAAMLEALERLQPNLAALVEEPAAKSASPVEPPSSVAVSHSCHKCGHQLVGDEQFCGQCGSPRAGDYEAPNMQTKVASMWHMQELQKQETGSDSAKNASEIAAEKPDAALPEPSIPRPNKLQIPEFLASADLEFTDEMNNTLEAPGSMKVHESNGVEEEEFAVEAEKLSGESVNDSQALAKPQLTHTGVWSSTGSARAFLERLASSKRAGTLLQLWNTRRGDIYLVIAVILVACVIRWGILSDRPTRATATPAATGATQHKPASEPGLSFFDRMLIQLGLAEAPEPAEDKGAPGIQVWVDERTALYYCPGTDLYGKTPKGKFTTQREAQLDQFEPAYRKVCN